MRSTLPFRAALASSSAVALLRARPASARAPRPQRTRASMNQELFDAASAGDVKAVRAALDAGADIAYKDVRRWPAACVRRARGG
jgi:hypothetical protein